MLVVELLKNIVVGVLVGYLSFTNSLASHIETFFSVPQQHKTVVEVSDVPEQNILKSIPSIAEGVSQQIARNILRNHADYQRAAVIAGTRDEETVPSDPNTLLDDTVKAALVNIYCQYKTDEYIRTTTGSGFFINQKGVILTNAHVAQFLLLKDAHDVVTDVECVVRSGNPATPKYTAELLYISPVWIFENSKVITEEEPRGTGERDYALLYVSKSIDNTPLPTRFPAISVDVALLARSVSGTSVVTAGYPAEALMRGGADAKLLPILASTTVGVLYTFGSNYADIFSISESPVGEQGASGGPIVNTDNHNAIGLIVTKGDEATEGQHSLRALTLSYVDRTITKETGYSLAQNMQGDVALRGNIFKKIMVPFLSKILKDELAGQSN